MKTPKEFNDSAEATDFISDIERMLCDPRLGAWAKSTDENYEAAGSRKHRSALSAAIANFTVFSEQLETVE